MIKNSKANIIGVFIGIVLMIILFNVFSWLNILFNNGLLSVIIPIIFCLSFVIPLISKEWEIKKLIKLYLFWIAITSIVIIIVVTMGDLFSSVTPNYKNEYFVETLSYELSFVAYFQLIIIIVKLFLERIKD
ncbi:MAG: hypothetical protein RBQ97_08910 [Acholeplasma sp.]|nr:hypothetical protein [Acholeplasma sp.]